MQSDPESKTEATQPVDYATADAKPRRRRASGVEISAFVLAVLPWAYSVLWLAALKFGRTSAFLDFGHVILNVACVGSSLTLVSMLLFGVRRMVIADTGSPLNWCTIGLNAAWWLLWLAIFVVVWVAG